MIGIAALLYVVVLMVLVNGVKVLLKHKKVRAGINRTATIASCFATGNYPGKARNIDELRADILKAASYIPGTHRLGRNPGLPADVRRRTLPCGEAGAAPASAGTPTGTTCRARGNGTDQSRTETRKNCRKVLRRRLNTARPGAFFE